MAPSYVALTALTDHIRPDELAAVAAALQVQVTRDFGPEWGVTAVVAALPFEAIPAGYIPLIIQDALEAEGTNGYHRTHSDDSPYVIVPYGRNWPLAASHELLRMLANPTGSARTAGPSRMTGQGTVEYLVDVCAPCEDVSAAYTVDGFAVADFCLRSFFGASMGFGAAMGSRSFTGALTTAFEPAGNGVVTWLADDGLLYQARADHQGEVSVHGGYSLAGRQRMLLRELVDRLTPDRLAELSNAPRTNRFLEAEQNARRARFANLTRFGDDIAWRFGHASVEPVDLAQRRDTARVKFQGGASAMPRRERIERTIDSAM